MKKLGIGLLSLILCAGMVLASGCASGSGDSKQPGTSVEETKYVDTKEPVTITVPDLITAATGENRFVAQRQKEFDEDPRFSHITVKHVDAPTSAGTANMTEYLTTVFMGSNSPVYMSVSSLTYINDVRNQGLAADIKPYLSEDSSFYKMYDYVQSAFTRDGAVIGWPSILEVPLLGFFNESLTAKGYDPANLKCDTWDEYYNIAKTINTEARAGASLYLYEYFLWPHNWFISNDASPATQNADGTITLNITSDKMVETLEFFRKLYQEGLTNTNVNYTDPGEMLNLIFGRKIASFTVYPTWIAMLRQYGIQPSDITMVQFPKGPSAEKKQSSVIASGFVFNAKKSPAELKAAVSYLEFMNGEQAYIDQMAFNKENDVISFQLPPFETVEWWDGMTENGIPQNWIDETKASLTDAALMQLSSTAFTSYLTTQLPLVVTDTSKSIPDALAKAQKTATDEWLTDYNQSVLDKR